MSEYQIERLQQPQSAIVKGADGQLYQITPVSSIQTVQVERAHRERLDRHRNKTANAFAYTVIGIGAVFAGVIVLMIFGALFASATRPPETKVTNPYCQSLCF